MNLLTLIVVAYKVVPTPFHSHFHTNFLAFKAFFSNPGVKCLICYNLFLFFSFFCIKILKILSFPSSYNYLRIMIMNLLGCFHN